MSPHDILMMMIMMKTMSGRLAFFWPAVIIWNSIVVATNNPFIVREREKKHRNRNRRSRLSKINEKSISEKETCLWFCNEIFFFRKYATFIGRRTTGQTDENYIRNSSNKNFLITRFLKNSLCCWVKKPLIIC